MRGTKTLFFITFSLIPTPAFSAKNLNLRVEQNGRTLYSYQISESEIALKAPDADLTLKRIECPKLALEFELEVKTICSRLQKAGKAIASSDQTAVKIECDKKSVSIAPNSEPTKKIEALFQKFTYIKTIPEASCKN